MTEVLPEFPAYAAEAIMASAFSRSRASGVRRADFESGSRQQIKMADQVLVTDSLAIQLSSSDYEAFKQWLENDVGRVGWFSYSPFGTATSTQARVVNGALKSERPLDLALSRWQVTLDLEYWSE